MAAEVCIAGLLSSQVQFREPGEDPLRCTSTDPTASRVRALAASEPDRLSRARHERVGGREAVGVLSARDEDDCGSRTSDMLVDLW